MNYNPYFQQPMYANNMYTQPRQDFQTPPMKNLQGKFITNESEVVSSEIPLDFSLNFFALTSGEAIFTKQLLQDGTSKIVKYIPATEEKKEQPKYILEKDFNEYKEEIENLIDELKKDIKAKKEK